VVVSLGKRLRSLGEHRGADEFPQAWQGEEDLRVAMLVRAGIGVHFTKLLIEFSDIPLGLTNLLVSELDPGEQGADVLGGGLNATRSQVQGRLGQNGVKLSGGESSNPIRPEEFCELSFAKPSSLMRSGSEQQERPQPRLVCGVT
jgi:hypothetical protein